MKEYHTSRYEKKTNVTRRKIVLGINKVFEEIGVWNVKKE